MHPTVIPASPLLGWTMSSTPLCFTFLSTAGATGLLLLLKRTPVQAPSLRQQQSTRYNVCNLYKAAGLIFLTARKIFQKWAQYTEYSISDIWSIKKIRYKLYQYSQYTETTVEVWKSDLSQIRILNNFTSFVHQNKSRVLHSAKCTTLNVSHLDEFRVH